MPEGSGRDILKARTEKRLAETVCEFVTHAYRQHIRIKIFRHLN